MRICETHFDFALMKKLSFSLFAAGCFSVPMLHGALVITDPTIVSGSEAITSVGSNASNSTPQATLEALSDFGAIQSFGFSGNVNGSQEYIFNNTGATQPDVRLTYLGAIGTGLVAISNTTFATSGGSSMRISGSGTGSYGMSILVGDWNGTTFSSGDALGVSALGFTLTGRYGQVDSVTITYFDALDNVLSTQVMPPTSATGTGTAAAYSGYQISTGQNNISRVEITVAVDSDPDTAPGLFGLDDLGFTRAVPEPSSSALIVGALGALALVRKRRVG